MTLDETALSAFVQAELPAVYSLSFRLCGNAPEAEGLCHAVFPIAFRKYPDPSSLPPTKNWLCKIIIDEWRAKPSVKTRPPEPKNADAAAKALNTLSADDKIVLVLRDIEKKTPAEISSITGISANALKSRLSRAREAFHQAFLRRPAGKKP